jgi:hypothetical protein
MKRNFSIKNTCIFPASMVKVYVDVARRTKTAACKDTVGKVEEMTRERIERHDNTVESKIGSFAKRRQARKKTARRLDETNRKRVRPTRPWRLPKSFPRGESSAPIHSARLVEQRVVSHEFRRDRGHDAWGVIQSRRNKPPSRGLP